MKKMYLGILIFLLLVCTTGCTKNIVGKWKSSDSDDELYYIFNNDKTCSYEMSIARLDCTYETENNRLTIMYKGSDKASTYEFRFEKNTLIIKDETGKDNRFIKEK